MENNIEKFDPSKLMDGVRDRIKATFVSLIPDDKWESLVKKEVESFFDLAVQEGYSKKYTQFQYVCSQVLADIVKDKISDFLKTYISDIWQDDAPKASELLINLLKENAADIFAAMMRQQVSKVIYEMKNRNY